MSDEAKVDEAKVAAAPAQTAQDLLREVEHKWLGEDAPRIDGKIDDGHGSRFSKLTKHQHAYHAALKDAAHQESKLAASEADVEATKARIVAAREKADKLRVD